MRHRPAPSRSIRASIGALVGVACTVAFTATAGATPVVVDIAEGVSPAAVAAKHGIAPDQVLTEVANGFTADVNDKQLKKLEADAAVQEVAEDGIYAQVERGTWRLAQSPRREPGTAPYAAPGQFEQYVTPEIRRVKAHLSVTADIDGVDDRRVDADIAILDGGVDPYHPDLNVAGGFDCVKGPREERGWADRDGHGTLAAGFAAAIDNGIGVVGTAPGARIWSVRIADQGGYITDSALLCGLEYVARNRSIEVANLSFAGADNDMGPCVDSRRWWRVFFRARSNRIDKVHQRLCRITAKGITVVAAAGNDGADASTYSPAAYDEVIAVSAIADYDGLPGGLAPVPEGCWPTELDDHFATFSNFGAVVDIAAPGVCVLSTLPGGQYAYVEGTSFAAPLVSGGAALIHARTRNARPDRVRAQLLASAQPGPIPGDPDAYPEGVLDVSSF